MTAIPRSDIRIGNLSHVGRQRHENQDYFGYAESASQTDFQLKGRIAVVCDGMGGHNGGQTASVMAVQTILDTFREDRTGNTLDILSRSITQANRNIFERQKRDRTLQGMGTTATALVLKNGVAYLGHVGDSRCYRLRHGTFERLTKDHSLVQLLVDQGKIRPEEAESHPNANVILRAVGIRESVQVDTYEYAVAEGDLFLLCSDGLCGYVQDQHVQYIIEQNRHNLTQGCQDLIDAANRAGGYDNITVQLVEVVRLPDPMPTDEEVSYEEVKQKVRQALSKVVEERA